MKARDIMTREFDTILPTATIKEAVSLLIGILGLAFLNLPMKSLLQKSFRFKGFLLNDKYLCP